MQVYKFFSLLIAAVLLAACSGPAASIQPTIPPTAEPSLSIDPKTGGPGTEITVIGKGFPASETISFYIGPPNTEASPEPLASVEVAANGMFTASFPLPSAWPDGTRITEPKLVIVAANAGFRVKATAELDFNSAGVADADAPDAALSARQILAQQLGIDLSAITIASAEKVEWPDGCLGIPIEGIACIQVVTPGYKVILEAEGKRYEYHTDETGAYVVLASIETSGGRLDASDGPVLAWHREGGIAGFCDDLTVYLTGDAFASSCKGNQPTNLGHARLTAEQLAQVYAWVDRLKSFEFERTDPAKVDQMTIRIVFSGAGSVDATDADIQAIQQFAADVFAGSSER